jgi:hypothetical protein
MASDRTELRDLSTEQPERVKAMSAVWFDMAENIDRVKGKQLAPVKEELSNIHFRKDTSSQLVEKNKQSK